MFTDVLPEVAVFPNKEPSSLHFQLKSLNSLDHGFRCEQVAGTSTETVQLPSGSVGAERHLLFGGSFGHTELVITAHGNGCSIN